MEEFKPLVSKSQIRAEAQDKLRAALADFLEGLKRNLDSSFLKMKGDNCRKIIQVKLDFLEQIKNGIDKL